MKRILTGGKFNHIHPGHVWLLKKAKKLGHLTVVIANDKHNRRPYAVAARKRKAQLEKLGIADKIIIGSPSGFVGMVKKHKPDMIVLGYDQKLPDTATEEYARKNKIRIVKFRKFGNHSTRELNGS